MITFKLMADYHCFPLWHAASCEVGNVDPRELPISVELCKKLLDWAQIYDATLNDEDPANSGFTSIEAKLQFSHDGDQLAEALRIELGRDYNILRQ